MRDRVAHYADYYGDPGLRKWRDLGGREKAANVVALWGDRQRPERVAEIGFGDGAVLAQLDRLGFGSSYVGYEVSPSAIKAAEQRQFAQPARFVEFDGSRVPAGDDEFELAILSHVLEHVDDPRALIVEAARIALHVFVEVPLELHARTPRHFTSTSLGHINLYNQLVIRQLIESCGLRVVAERVSQPSRDICYYQRSKLKGTLKWVTKTAALHAGVGPLLFTYHGSLLAARD